MPQGYKMIGTTSWGVANTLGYSDGENISFQSYLEIIKNILEVISIPLSIDIESGFSTDKEEIIDNIVKLAGIGCSGVNIEDSTTSYALKDATEFSNLLKELRKELDNSGYADFFVNARVDTYIALKNGQLDETIKRSKAYEEAGADGVFVPLISDEADIKKLLDSITRPLNVMSLPNLTNIDKLEGMGVKCFSIGNAMSDYIVSEIERLSRKVLEERNTESLYDHGDIKSKFNSRK